MSQHILFVGSVGLDGPVRLRLEQRGFAVSVVKNLECSIDQLIESGANLIVVNLDDNENGVALIKRIRTAPTLNSTQVLAVGEWGTGKPTVALSAGADAFEPTGIDARRVVDAVERLLNKRAAVVGINE